MHIFAAPARRPAFAALAAFAACAALAACGPSGGPSNTSGAGAGAGNAASANPPPAAPSSAPSAEDAAILAGLPAPYNEGDLVKGRREFAKCRSCHTIEKGGPNRVGPALHGIFGRRAGATPGFQYSDAVRNAGFDWDAAKLDQWLVDPKGFLPGNRMSFAGIKDETARRDLIAYIKVESAK